jgi:lysophospholipase L1-like esterase
MAARLVIALAGIVAGCDVVKSGGGSSPTGPSPIGPPQPGAAVNYSAIGASDANGVGSSVPCLPFSPCDDGKGYVPVLAGQLRASRQVTVLNLGIPASVLSPAIEAIARQYGREVTGNFVDRQMPFVPREATLVTIFGGPNDANAIGDAIAAGAAGASIPGYIAAQASSFGADYDRLVRGVRSRAPNAFIIVVNVPNLAALPYAGRYPLDHRRVLQAVSNAFSREANRQAGSGVVVMDVMCDADMYNAGRFSSDGFHPNDAGYAHIAARLAAIVNGGAAGAAASCAQMTVVPAL